MQLLRTNSPWDMKVAAKPRAGYMDLWVIESFAGRLRRTDDPLHRGLASDHRGRQALPPAAQLQPAVQRRRRMAAGLLCPVAVLPGSPVPTCASPPGQA